MRAILHGGIPLREVQDDYIQEEILKGFDVSCVFEPKFEAEPSADQQYYQFRAEIETKEQIREYVSHADTAVAASIIAQLERWWDKYHISLHQLDAEVAAAEQVVQGYLKELGYE